MKGDTPAKLWPPHAHSHRYTHTYSHTHKYLHIIHSTSHTERKEGRKRLISTGATWKELKNIELHLGPSLEGLCPPEWYLGKRPTDSEEALLLLWKVLYFLKKKKVIKHQENYEGSINSHTRFFTIMIVFLLGNFLKPQRLQPFAKN